MTTREAATDEDKDFIEHLFTASTHDYLMFFTNTGRVYVERVHEIPDMGRAAKGRSIANLLELKAGEKVAALIRILSKTDANKEDVTWQQSGELFFATKQGTVKKTSLNEFSNVRKGGIIAIGIDPGDALIEVKSTRGSVDGGDPGDDVVLITKDGMSIRFSEADVRSMGRAAGGVKGITLEKGDEVVALAVVVPDATLLVAGENGIGKRTAFEEYLVQAESGLRKQSRGGKGRVTMKVGEKTGAVVGALTVRDQDEIMLITVGGQMVRIPVQGIREAGRNTQGVKLIELESGDKLQAIAQSSARTRKTPPGRKVKGVTFPRNNPRVWIFQTRTVSQQMPHLCPFRLQIPFVVRIRLHANRHLLDDFQSVALQPDDFFRIVGQQPDGFQAEVHEDLRAEAVFAQVHVEAELFVRLNGVVALFLQFVGLDFRREADAASFLPHIDNHAAAGVGDLPHGLMQLRPAIAAARAEHVAGQTFAVDAHQNIFLPGHLAAHERQMMLAVGFRAIQMQIEIAVIGRQFHGLDLAQRAFRACGGIGSGRRWCRFSGGASWRTFSVPAAAPSCRRRS